MTAIKSHHSDDPSYVLASAPLHPESDYFFYEHESDNRTPITANAVLVVDLQSPEPAEAQKNIDIPRTIGATVAGVLFATTLGASTLSAAAFGASAGYNSRQDGVS